MLTSRRALSRKQAKLLSPMRLDRRMSVKEQARQSLNLFATLFEMSPVATFLTRPSDRRIIAINDAALRLTGNPRHAVVGAVFADVLRPLDPDAYEKLRSRVLSGEHVRDEPVRAEPQEGRRIDVLFAGSLATIDGVPHIVYSLSDVTALNRAMARESQLHAKYAALFDTSPEAIVVMRLKDGMLIEANQAAYDQVHLSREAARGRSVPELGIGAAPEERDRIIAQINAEGRIINRPTRFRRGDGTWFEMLLSAQKLRLEGESCVVWSWRDLTDLRRAEVTLRESEARFRSLTEFFASYFWEIDADLRFTLVEGRGVQDIGLRAEDLIGRRSTEVSPDWELLRPTRAEFDALRAQRLPYQDVLTRLRLPSGEYRYLSIWGKPRFAPDGRFLGYLGVTQDVTERVRLEQDVRQLNETLERRVAERTAELELANRDLDSFGYSVSHDLRTPLSSISGFADLLRETEAGRLSGEGMQMLLEIETNTTRMTQMLEGLLAFSRLGRKPVSKARVPMAALVDEAVRELRSRCGAPRVEFRLGRIPDAEGDPVLLRQVWENLLGNAVKFSRGRNPPIVEAGYDEQRSAYFVRDNGVGFERQYADRLFGVFERLHTDSQFEGTGVGLAIVQRIVQKHGGDVIAESDRGRGATFRFTLPA